MQIKIKANNHSVSQAAALCALPWDANKADRQTALKLMAITNPLGLITQRLIKGAINLNVT